MQHHTQNELDEATRKVAAMVLVDCLEKSMPSIGDRFSVERFFVEAKPALLDWLASRLEAESTILKAT